MEAENPKDRIGQSKPPLHLIPAAGEILESIVMGLGADKYGPFNWRDHKVFASVYVSAAKRHIAQWFDGEENDPESGVSHLAHARACMGILLDAQAIGNMGDDRPKRGAASSLIKEHTLRETAGDDPLRDGSIALEHVRRPAVAVDRSLGIDPVDVDTDLSE